VRRRGAGLLDGSAPPTTLRLSRRLAKGRGRRRGAEPTAARLRTGVFQTSPSNAHYFAARSWSRSDEGILTIRAVDDVCVAWFFFSPQTIEKGDDRVRENHREDPPPYPAIRSLSWHLPRSWLWCNCGGPEVPRSESMCVLPGNRRFL
jgi:hypothetical protein